MVGPSNLHQIEGWRLRGRSLLAVGRNGPRGVVVASFGDPRGAWCALARTMAMAAASWTIVTNMSRQASRHYLYRDTGSLAMSSRQRWNRGRGFVHHIIIIGGTASRATLERRDR